MLHSLLFQILQQDSRLFTSFREVYRSLREKSENTVNWPYECLKKIFLNLATFDKFSLRIYFIIDAMDESDDGDSGNPIIIIQRLFRTSSLHHQEHSCKSPF